jgi:hypothetical protein
VIFLFKVPDMEPDGSPTLQPWIAVHAEVVNLNIGGAQIRQ